MQKQIKHGGCYRCKSMDQEILKSVAIKGEFMGQALCDPCIKALGDKVSVPNGGWE
jgi:hypothetical protein